MAYRTAIPHEDTGIYDGVLLPERGRAREHRAAIEGAGVADWGFHGLLRVTGPDREEFLHRLLSHTLPRPAESGRAFLLNVTGKPVAEFWVHSFPDETWLELPRAQARAALEQLEHYHFTERLQIVDASADYSPIAFLGPKAVPPGGRVTRSSYLACPTQVLWVPSGEAARAWEAAFATRPKPVHVGTRAMEILRVEAGSPRWGVDYDDNTLFLEMAPPDSYSETKGCYIGQEVVARVLHRGHVNRRLVGVRAEGKKEIQGKLLAEGKEVGRVTSSVVSPEHGPIGLAYVRRESWHAGTGLSTEKGRDVRIHELPFRPVQGGLPCASISS